MRMSVIKYLPGSWYFFALPDIPFAELALCTCRVWNPQIHLKRFTVRDKRGEALRDFASRDSAVCHSKYILMSRCRAYLIVKADNLWLYSPRLFVVRSIESLREAGARSAAHINHFRRAYVRAVPFYPLERGLFIKVPSRREDFWTRSGARVVSPNPRGRTPLLPVFITRKKCGINNLSHAHVR